MNAEQHSDRTADDGHGPGDESALGFGSALAAAVANLKDQPLLSFGLAAAMVAGIVGSVASDNWIVLAVVAGLCVATLVVWALTGRGAPEHAPDLDVRRRLSVSGRVEDRARLQSYRGPAGARVRVRSRARFGRGSRVGPGAEIQTTDIYADPPRESEARDR